MNNPVFVDGYPLPDVGRAVRTSTGHWTVGGHALWTGNNDDDFCRVRAAQWIAVARAIDAETRAAERAADDDANRVRRRLLLDRLNQHYLACTAATLSPADVVALHDMLNEPTT